MEGVDAEQLAGWAMVLLSRRLAARPGSVTRVTAGDCAALRGERFDLAVVPVRAEAWLGYVMLRIAPGINRTMARPLSIERLAKLGARLSLRSRSGS